MRQEAGHLLLIQICHYCPRSATFVVTRKDGGTIGSSAGPSAGSALGP